MPTFVCQNAGCGYQSFFVDDEKQSGYLAHGMTWPPRNCPDCREFKKAQIDTEIICKYCGGYRLETAGKKIMFNKHDGKYVEPDVCNACEQDPGRVERFRQATKRAKEAREARATKSNKKLPFHIELEVDFQKTYDTKRPYIVVNYDHYYYHSIVDTSGNFETRAEHILNHENDIRPHTGQPDLQLQLQYLAWLATVGDPGTKMVLNQGRGNKTIVIDISKNTPKALMMVIQKQLGENIVITSYAVDAKYVSRKINSGSWSYP